MLRPPFLTNGSLVRLVSPAGAIDAAWIQGASACLEQWGLRVKVGSHADARMGRFAGSANERRSDLQEALDDPDCSAIFCTRGGYGTVQLIEQLSLEGFRKHPKWLIGFSDITMLHALLDKNGFLSIHGGMAKAMAESLTQPSESMDALRGILLGQFPRYSVPSHPLNRMGMASGVMVGGNLSILYSLRGTSYDHIPEKSILFIEDIGEQPYVIDRMMHNLKLGGVLQRLSGLIVGQFSDCEADPSFGQTIEEIIASAVAEYAFPTCFNFPVGHVERNYPMICGASACLHIDPKGVELIYQLA
jgi:muramoyltetrapeptide carboxypeptidase